MTGSFDRLVAKGGTITVDYTGSGASKLELGNAGRDIASSGDLYFRPVTLGSAQAVRFSSVGGSAYAFAPQGEFGMSKNGNVLLVHNTLGGAGNPAATAGFFQNDDATSVAPALIAQNVGVGDAFQAKVFGAGNTKSAVYGENASSNGFAGYFSGRVLAASTNGTALSVSATSNTSALSVTQINAGGVAASIFGKVEIKKMPLGSSGLVLGSAGAGNAVDLCLYGSGAPVCKSSWPNRDGSGGGDPTSYWAVTSTVPPYLYPRDAANNRVYIGYAAPPGAPDQTSLSVYNNSTNSTVYGQQDNASGWAGYFKGGLVVHSGVPALGVGSPQGDKLRLGTPGTSGVAWNFIEAENWDTTVAMPACINKNFADNSASNGHFVNIACGAGPIPPDYISMIPINNLPQGTYKLVVRMKAANTTFTSDAVTIGINGTGRMIVGTEFGGGNNGWSTLDYTFNVNANGQDIYPFFRGTRLNDIGVDWLMIVPATESPKLLHGVRTLAAPGAAYIDIGTNLPTSTYDCEAAVDEVTGNHASGFGCRFSGLALQGFVNPGGAGSSITCSYSCFPK